MLARRLIAAAGLALLASQPVLAVEFATRQEAEAMVAKAVAAIRADRPKTLEEITAKDPKWVDRDLYPLVIDTAGRILAHGANSKMVGVGLIAFKDIDGKAFVKEGLDALKTSNTIWLDFKFTEPLSKKVWPKSLYCEKLDSGIVCAGVYKR